MRNGWKAFGVVSALVLPAVLTGCGVGGAAQQRDVSEEVLADVKQELEPPDLNASIYAATVTAQSSQACALNQNFYWEIGTRHGALAGGSVVNNADGIQFDAQTYMGIASASKMIFSAYVFESCGGVACNYGTGLAAVNALRMLAGYRSSTSYCPYPSTDPTVATCAVNAGVVRRSGRGANA